MLHSCHVTSEALVSRLRDRVRGVASRHTLEHVGRPLPADGEVVDVVMVSDRPTRPRPSVHVPPASHEPRRLRGLRRPARRLQRHGAVIDTPRIGNHPHRHDRERAP
jgi:hypothetical protein